jgi:IclR family transcriptional regulator, acetate operon repressor
MLAALDRAGARSILAAAGMPRKTPHTITDPETLLVELDTVAQRGYAVDDEEDVEGVFCVGASVRDHTDRCAGAISVTGIKRDLPSWQVALLGAKVREHAERISSLLGAPS